MGYRPVVTSFDPMYTHHFASSEVSIHEGDMLVLESGIATLMDAVTESTDFIGISAGVESNSTVPVHLRCLVKINLVEANYSLGDGLKYSARETLVADGDEYSIAHYWGSPNIYQPTANVSFGHVMFDVTTLFNNNWDVISA